MAGKTEETVPFRVLGTRIGNLGTHPPLRVPLPRRGSKRGQLRRVLLPSMGWRRDCIEVRISSREGVEENPIPSLGGVAEGRGGWLIQ